jgi:hypothetical protein
VVHRALSKNPDERHANAEEMRDALIAAASGTAPETILSGAGPASTQAVRRTDAGGADDATEAIARTTAPAPVITQPPPGAARRRLWLLAGLVALMVMGTAAAVWFAMRADTPEQPSVPSGAEQGSEEPAQQEVAPPEETEPEPQEAVPPAHDPQQGEKPAEEPQVEQPTEEPPAEEPAAEDRREEDPLEEVPQLPGEEPVPSE